ncbi:protein TonB [Ensifer adhaerens]|nr:protein TonB [Ensifer adhaerens]
MKDPHLGKPGRTALSGSVVEPQRRKVWRGDRRAPRAWTPLPVPAMPAGARSDIAPTVDWPHGHTIDRADDWLDRADQRDLGVDFKPVADVPFADEAVVDLQAGARSKALKICLLASVALHLACAVFFLAMPAPDQVNIAGGGAVSVMLIGDQAFDSLAAGQADGEETASPADETKPVEADEPPVEAAAVEPTVEPIEESPAVSEPRPVLEATAVSPPAEPQAAEAAPEQLPRAVPDVAPEATTDHVAATESLAIDPSTVSENGELAASAQVAAEATPEEPVNAPPAAVEPVTKPQNPTQQHQPEKRLAEKKMPPPKKVEKPKPADKAVSARKQADVDREARSAARKKQKGEAGEAEASAQRGASANANGGTRPDPGNAAVSNYPGKVAAKLRRALKYPRSSVSGRGGQAQVAFTVLADGSATGIRVVSSSGSTVLDQAAVEAVRRASPFPPIPGEVGRSQWPFSVPVLFKR